MDLNKGTQLEMVHNILLENEYIDINTIVKKTGIQKQNMGYLLTTLRRKGLAECSGVVSRKGSRGLVWKKHSTNSPLYPPQPDIIYKPSKAKVERYEAESSVIINHIIDCLNDLKNAISKECNSDAQNKVDLIKNQLGI